MAEHRDIYNAAVAVFASAISTNPNRLRDQDLMKECVLAARELEILAQQTHLHRDGLPRQGQF